MKKIAIFTDLHLGVTNYGSIGKDGIHSRFKDFKNTFENFAKDCVEREVDIVLFGGDAFEIRNPPPYQLVAFLDVIKYLIDNNIKVFIIAGNHDIFKTEGYVSILEVTTFLGAKVLYKPTFELVDSVSILFLPYMFDMSVNDISDKIDELVYNTKDSGDIIGIGHWGIEGAQLGGEKGLTVGKDIALPKSIFAKHKNVSWYFGHYHKSQIIAKNIKYIGSMDRTDFGECEERKGWAYIEYEDGKIIFEDFMKNKVRDMNKIRFNIEDNSVEDIVKELDKLSKDSINWLILECKAEDRPRAISYRSQIQRKISNVTFLPKVDIECFDKAKMEFANVEMDTISKEIANYLGEKYSKMSDSLIEKHNTLTERDEVD